MVGEVCMIPALARREKTVKILDKKKRRHQPAFQSALDIA